MIQTITCTIPPSLTSYEIEILPRFLENPQKLTHYLRPYGPNIAIITDDVVNSLFGSQLCNTLLLNHFKASLFCFFSGEQHKTRQTKEYLEDQLLEKGFGRDTCIVALGGGVVTDMAGFLAATYCRGVPLILIPTTLLAMVDASIGGKTGVNVPQGKNMVGTLYHPKKVLIDPFALQSLSVNEMKYGSIEMIKHALIAEPAYFEFLESNSQNLLKLNPDIVQKAIFDSCCIKVSIVQEDERDTGKRNLLNFGHTIGHALETITHFSMPHGQAVALGILAESHIAVQLGHLDQKSFERICAIIDAFAISREFIEVFSSESLLDMMILDKKSVKGEPRFVLLKGIGSPLPCNGTYCSAVEKNLIVKAIEWIHHALCRD